MNLYNNFEAPSALKGTLFYVYTYILTQSCMFRNDEDVEIADIIVDKVVEDKPSHMDNEQVIAEVCYLVPFTMKYFTDNGSTI